jgi:hypothetical protein
MIMNICCLLLVGGSLERIRFGPLRRFGFRVIDGLGKQSALCQLTPAGLRMEGPQLTRPIAFATDRAAELSNYLHAACGLTTA